MLFPSLTLNISQKLVMRWWVTDKYQTYLIAENLSYELDAMNPLFAGIHLSISAADRISLVGANGCAARCA